MDNNTGRGPLGLYNKMSLVIDQYYSSFGMSHELIVIFSFTDVRFPTKAHCPLVNEINGHSSSIEIVPPDLFLN